MSSKATQGPATRTPCCIPGCMEPRGMARSGWIYTQCTAHQAQSKANYYATLGPYKTQRRYLRPAGRYAA